jgi:hypothetical protein
VHREALPYITSPQLARVSTRTDVDMAGSLGISIAVVNISVALLAVVLHCNASI